jgi:hypothetical protein
VLDNVFLQGVNENREFLKTGSGYCHIIATDQPWRVFAQVNNLEMLGRAACLQQDEHVELVYIRRNLPDVIFSLAKRFGCPVRDLASEVAAWHSVEQAVDQAMELQEGAGDDGDGDPLLFTRSSSSRAHPVLRAQLEELVCSPEKVVGEICAALSLVFDMAMVERPEAVVLSNKGGPPRNEHDRLRMAQINGPMLPYDATVATWEKESSLVSDDDCAFLRGLSA